MREGFGQGWFPFREHRGSYGQVNAGISFKMFVERRGIAVPALPEHVPVLLQLLGNAEKNKPAAIPSAMIQPLTGWVREWFQE